MMKFTEDFKQFGWPSTVPLNKASNRVGPLAAPTTTSSTSGTSSSSSSSASGRPCAPLKQDYGNKFHRAALDGYVDMLCEASRRDTNLVARDHHLQLTPTLVAAQCGQLDALRMLVGRGGDPERVTSLGSSALHLAAARNHLNCVSFLVNFGVNMWALDNELHTAKDVAAVEQSKEVLEYLDQMMARQSAVNTKLVQKLKDKAKNGAEKRLKQQRKLQLKAIKQIERDERLLAKMSQNRRLLKAAHSMSDIKLVGRSCSELNKLPQVNLLPHETCDTSSSGPGTGSNSSSASSKTIANFIQQRLQQDLLAISRRARHQQQRQLLAKETGTSSNANSSYPSSLVSSTSGYLSSCSAKSILKSASGGGGAVKSHPSLLTATAGSAPKYSDLVAVKRDELREAEKERLESKATKEAHKSSCSSGSMIASKLRVIGGVSRKVHLKRLLFSASKQTDEVSGLSASNSERLGTMKRTRSEPDFGAALRQSEESDDGEDDTDQEDHCQQETMRRASQHDKCHSESVGADGAKKPNAFQMGSAPPPRPPPLPPPAPAAGPQENQRQMLLTQCLSQLKLQQQQHEESSSNHSAQLVHPFGHSDELLQHQISAGEFPLRPSIIKHQQQQRRRPASSDHAADKQHFRPPGSAVDSIGSVSSFVARNQEEAGLCHQTAAVSPNHQRHSIHQTEPTSGRCPLRSSRFSYSRSSTSSASDPIQCDTVSSSSSSHNPNHSHKNGTADAHEVQDAKLRDFLARNNLAELSEVLARERIDFEALMLLDESDLKSINLLLGPRRKLLNAIERHKSGGTERAHEEPEVSHTRAQKQIFMVDTQF